MIDRRAWDVVVVGGGFFGCSLASTLAAGGKRVLLLERSGQLLGRASYHNQARVHQGYHYPRSVLTALRSRINFPRFVDAYRPAIVDDFEKVYAIGRRHSKVSAGQFRRFMERVGAPLGPAPTRVEKLFAPHLVEAVFSAREFAFDAVKLRALMLAELERTRVEVALGAHAVRLAPRPGGGLLVSVEQEGETLTLEAGEVFNCTYSQLNELLHASGLPLLRLKHELAEMCLVDVPDELRSIGVTVMCGPFFSLMPFPARGRHTLSHVRYTPHGSWHDAPGHPWTDPSARLASGPPSSHFRHMRLDSQRYLPALSACRHVDSLWELKTVLPASEHDDSRPILWRPDCGLPGHTAVLGAKIDNVFDVLSALDNRPVVAPQ